MGFERGELPRHLHPARAAAERLVHVLPRAIRVDGSISVVHLERQQVARPVRAFVDAVVAWAPKLQEVAEPRELAPPRELDELSG